MAPEKIEVEVVVPKRVCFCCGKRIAPGELAWQYGEAGWACASCLYQGVRWAILKAQGREV